jgi:hypothetical protein
MLTDTLMWKLVLRPPNSQKRNTKMGISLQCSPGSTLAPSDTVDSVGTADEAVLNNSPGWILAQLWMRSNQAVDEI